MLDNNTVKKANSVVKKIDKLIVNVDKRNKRILHDAAYIYVITGRFPAIENPLIVDLAKSIKEACDRWIRWHEQCVENGRKGARFGILGGAPKKSKSEKENNVNLQNKQHFSVPEKTPISSQKECKKEGNVENESGRGFSQTHLNVKSFEIDTTDNTTELKNFESKKNECLQNAHPDLQEKTKRGKSRMVNGVPVIANTEDGYKEIYWRKLGRMMHDFGKVQGFSKSVCTKFIKYTYNHWQSRLGELTPTRLYDKDGNIINNWKGAMKAFVKADQAYNREQWCKDHDISYFFKTKRRKLG